MGLAKKKSSKSQEISLPSVLDIRYAGAFYEEIKAVSKAGENLVLNGESVEKLTTPAIQVLLSSSDLVAKKKGSFKIKTPSDEMEKVFVSMGLESQFNEWK